MATNKMKFFVALLLTLYIAQVTHTRHIRSVDDVTQQEQQEAQEQQQQQQDDSSVPPPPPDGGAKSQQDDSSVPPPPPDGGAKSPVLPESPKKETPKEPPRESTQAPPAVRDENRTKPNGKMGFGGPPASGDTDDVSSEGGEKVVPPGVKVEKKQQDGTVETPGGVLSSCRVCPPGSGVVRPCNSTEDTVCAPCTEGTYSEGYSATASCRQCSICPLSYYQKTPCVADADVICGACHSHGNGFGNEDFLKQCEGATLPPTTMSTPTTTITVHDKDVGSGEEESSTLEAGLLPVQTVLPVTKETADPLDNADVMAVEQPYMGEAKAKEKEQDAESGKFQWPILVAAIVSGLVFFIVGILASMWCKKAAREQKQKEDMYGENSVRSTMIRHTNNDYSPSRASSGYHESDSSTPLNPVHVLYHGQPDFTPAILHHGMFYNSNELFYIDEDSDDEVANQLGRPSTIHGHDSQSKPKSLMQRVRDSPLVARITGSPRSMKASTSKRPLYRQNSVGSASISSGHHLGL